MKIKKTKIVISLSSTLVAKLDLFVKGSEWWYDAEFRRSVTRSDFVGLALLKLLERACDTDKESPFIELMDNYRQDHLGEKV